MDCLSPAKEEEEIIFKFLLKGFECEGYRI